MTPELDPAKQKEFRELCERAHALKQERAMIALKQMQMAYEINQRIIREAFLDVPVIQKKLLGQVQPDDYAKAAMEVVDKLRQAGITPSEIWLDDGRLLITLIQ